MTITAWGSPSRLNTPHRVLVPMDALAARGHAVEVVLVEETEVGRELRKQSDVLFVHRSCDRRAFAVVDAQRRAGAAIVWDNDDELTMNLPSANVRSSKSSVYAQETRLRVRQMLGLADLVTAPSSVLCDAYREEGAAEVRMMENYLPSSFFRTASRRRDRVTIGLVAAVDHLYDVRELGLSDVLRRVLADHPYVDVLSVGIDLGLRSDRYRFLPSVPYDQLPLTIGSFDVALAPLVDVRFNQCRASSKLKEYSALGVPWLASPVGPYRDLGQRQGGQLVDDERWYEEIVALIVNERRRRSLGKRALRWARGESIDRHAASWEAVMTEAVSLRSRASN